MNSPLLAPRTEINGTYSPLLSSETRLAMPFDEQRDSKYPSIYRVPAFVTNLKPEAYQPQVVSFGPYHHGQVHLRQMEEYKGCVLRHFIDRSRKSLEYFLDSMNKVAQDLEDRYDMLDPKWKEDGRRQFLKMMITDGCFMLEIMRATTMPRNDYAPNHPIFSKDRLTFIKPFIKRDMLLLENQLPMLVLHELVAAAGEDIYSFNVGEGQCGISNLILEFYSFRTKSTGMGRCLHVVDLFRKGLLETSTNKVQQKQENVAVEAPKEAEEIIRSATELNDTGIRFTKSKTDSLKDISFARGVLKLPLIKVDDTTESMFLNLMSFERLHNGAGNEVTAYVTFMDNIINDEQDVALLHTEGIIQNAIGSNKAVAKLFNSLCKEVPLASNSNLDAVHKDISKHCDNCWNTWRANLHRKYFKSPWSFTSLIAAILLFILTAIQTYYTVLSYL